MQQNTMQYVWIDGHHVGQAAPVEREETLGRTLWKYGWGLLFVVVMTLLSVFGPRTVYSKVPPTPPAESQPATHAVK